MVCTEMVMSTLILYENTVLDDKLLMMWENESEIGDWREFIKHLDDSIISVRFAHQTTQIEFPTEVHKTWFLLKWS